MTSSRAFINCPVAAAGANGPFALRQSGELAA